MCYGGAGQTQQALAGGIPPLVAGTGSGSETIQGSILGGEQGPTAPRVDILVTPRGEKGYDFVAVNSGDNPKSIRGQFNVTTSNDTGKVRPGRYTLSFRPHIEEKSGLAGIKQQIGTLLSGNVSLDINKNEGYPTLSNTDDWNTIIYKDGTKLGGVMIHPGHDRVTGQGGRTEGCFVTDRPTYEQLHQMLIENSNNNGKAYFHLQPRKVSQ
ncbi:MAG TPA: hypothetical protein VEF34_06390 [Syntrophobacteraceae bacterium]|nr:hypothetical protein [Syntrophobacteraceae bacterium]